MNDMSAIIQQPAARRYRMTAKDYIRVLFVGGFDDAHVELVDGELIEMAPAQTDHGECTASLLIDLAAIYRPAGCKILTYVIVMLNDETVRSPDISIADREIAAKSYLAPTEVLLAVEVANSTLTIDLGRKRIDYAAAGIRNYWVVDLVGRRVHTFADPQGADYASLRVVPFGQAISVPDAEGAVTIT